MMDFLRSWLIGITAAAIVLALADSLMPTGSVKRIGKLAGGLVLMFAILRPVMNIDYEMLSGALAGYRFEAQQYSSSLEIENERLKKIIIEDRTGAYIQEKAEELGVSCDVDVTCRVNEEELFYPASVVISGDFTQEQINSLMRIVEADLAIPGQMQQYERTAAP